MPKISMAGATITVEIEEEQVALLVALWFEKTRGWDPRRRWKRSPLGRVLREQMEDEGRWKRLPRGKPGFKGRRAGPMGGTT